MRYELTGYESKKLSNLTAQIVRRVARLTGMTLQRDARPDLLIVITKGDEQGLRDVQQAISHARMQLTRSDLDLLTFGRGCLSTGSPSKAPVVFVMHSDVLDQPEAFHCLQDAFYEFAEITEASQLALERWPYSWTLHAMDHDELAFNYCVSRSETEIPSLPVLVDIAWNADLLSRHRTRRIARYSERYCSTF